MATPSSPKEALAHAQRRRGVVLVLAFVVLAAVALVPTAWTIHELPTRAAATLKQSFSAPALLVHYTDKRRSLELETKWTQSNDHAIDIRFYDDDACLALVKQYRPHFVQTYLSQLSIVERADYFRYLVVWVYGGLYIDTDISFTKPVDQWLATFGWDNERRGASLLSTVDLVVGVEFPKPQTEYKNTGWLPVQINQFLFAGAQGSDVMKRLIDHMEVCITTIPRTDVELTLERTGPAAFTRAIITEIEKRALVSPVVHDAVKNSTSDKRHPPALLPLDLLEKNGQLIAIAKSADPIKQTSLAKPYEYILILPYRAFGYNDAHGGIAPGPVLAFHRNQNSWRSKPPHRN